MGPAQYYRLDRSCTVDRVYEESKSSIEGELHKISWIVLERQLMCRHQVEAPRRSTVDQSKVELEHLELLMPDERPTSTEVKEAVAVHRHGADAVEQAKLEKIERLASSAAAPMQEVVRRLAERVVRHEDERARTMMSCLGGLAKTHRAGEISSDSLRPATAAIRLAASLITFDPEARQAELPQLADSKALSLVDSLEALRHSLLTDAAAQDNFANRPDGSHNARAYRAAASVLRVAIYHILSSAKLR